MTSPIAAGLRTMPPKCDVDLAEALVDLLGLREKFPDVLDVQLLASYSEPAKAVVTFCIRQDVVDRLATAALPFRTDDASP